MTEWSRDRPKQTALSTHRSTGMGGFKESSSLPGLDPVTDFIQIDLQ